MIDKSCCSSPGDGVGGVNTNKGGADQAQTGDTDDHASCVTGGPQNSSPGCGTGTFEANKKGTD